MCNSTSDALYVWEFVWKPKAVKCEFSLKKISTKLNQTTVITERIQGGADLIPVWADGQDSLTEITYFEEELSNTKLHQYLFWLWPTLPRYELKAYLTFLQKIIYIYIDPDI